MSWPTADLDRHYHGAESVETVYTLATLPGPLFHTGMPVPAQTQREACLARAANASRVNTPRGTSDAFYLSEEQACALRRAMNRNNLTASALSRKIGETKGCVVSDWFTRRRRVTTWRLERVFAVLGEECP